ncbi:hypothetical protein KM043_015848 [Ampulex compressa]|nr:hypothetical protein KM043_015848 [Ampulex compressa]
MEANGRKVKSTDDLSGDVYFDWTKSVDLELLDATPNVTIFRDTDPFLRVAGSDVIHIWTYSIIATRNALRWIYLSLDQHRDNFDLMFIMKDEKKIEITKKHIWRDTEPVTEEDAKQKAKYTVKKICIDCLPQEDFSRIEEATTYQLSQLPKPFPRHAETPEGRLSKRYPYPSRENFFLTQESLTDDKLTASNYGGRMHELVAIEEIARHEQIARYNEVARMHLLPYYILSSNGDASTIAKYAAPGELFAQLPLSRNVSEDTKSGRLFLRGCDSILFKTVGSDGKWLTAHEAHIEDKCTQVIYVRLSKACVDALNLAPDTDLEVHVQFLLNRLPFCEWHKAIDSLPDRGLVFPNEHHEQKNTTTVLNLLQQHIHLCQNSLDWEWLIYGSMLNAEQKRAVAIMTAPINITLPPVLLLGPFGTGKTYVIAQALHMLLTLHPKHKILLCTHSNSAADLYVKDYFDEWCESEKNSRLRPTRIYYKGRARNTVHPVVQKYCLMDENGNFRVPKEEDVRDSSLIITTLSTSGSLTSLNMSPTHIIIDEAAQALECECLIPLSLVNPDTRVILAGDHMQLATEIYSDLASERGLDIVKFMSDMFYNGMVKSANNLIKDGEVFKPLTFYAVEGEEVQNLHSTSYTHASEACVLANRVYDLRLAWPVHRWGPYGEGSIGVLTYYAEQVQRIRTELRKRKLFDVSVERVLNVQGKQFVAVFISTVRTRSCCRYSAERNVKDYGFLTNPRLLITAVTRARSFVAVVGDPVALLTIGSCRALWQKFLEMADLHGIDWSNLMQELSAVTHFPLTPPLNPLAKEFVPKNPQSSRIVKYVDVPTQYPVVHCTLQLTMK